MLRHKCGYMQGSLRASTGPCPLWSLAHWDGLPLTARTWVLTFYVHGSLSLKEATKLLVLPHSHPPPFTSPGERNNGVAGLSKRDSVSSRWPRSRVPPAWEDFPVLFTCEDQCHSSGASGLVSFGDDAMLLHIQRSGRSPLRIPPSCHRTS